MILENKTLKIDGQNGHVLLWRTDTGVVQIAGDSEQDLARGLGYAHAHDRLAQMVFVRLVGQGRLAECLNADDEAVRIDVAMRHMGMARDARQDVANLTDDARRICDAYAAGVNHCMQRHWPPPVELLLTGHRPEPWEPADTLLTLKLMSYVGLAQAQQDTEKWIIQAVLAGVDLDRLRDLFAPHLDPLRPEWLEGLTVTEPLVPHALRWLSGMPRVAASNNWVVAAARSATGFPLLCNDPHLEVNRLPPVWSEAVLNGPDDWCWMGATMPGICGGVLGRTRHVAVGLTYGFADQIDYFIEDCKEGAFRRGDDFVPFDVRTELIRRKGKEPVSTTVYENLHGVLEGDPTRAGRYLCRAWSSHRDGGSPSMNALVRLWRARDVEGAMTALRELGISGNWVVADRSNIGYQQSGAVPLRAPEHSGLHPVPGWDERFDWRGLADPETSSNLYNPPAGFIATANDDWNQEGRTAAINLHMSSYRVDRIRELLTANPQARVSDMKQMQRDLVSNQVRRFMPVLRPQLPDNGPGRRLRDWNGVYSAESIEAAWFESIYEELKREVFGRGFVGETVWEHLEGETGLIADFHGHFDRILLEGDERWFRGEDRETLFRRVAAEVLSRADTIGAWGRSRQLDMAHIMFGGKLPRWLGFDHGPITLPGSRATIPQAAIYRSGGRLTSFAPSWRMITDMGEAALHTNLAGGPSGDRLSPWYKADIERWLRGDYKVLRPQPPPVGIPILPGFPGPSAAGALLEAVAELVRAALAFLRL